MMKPGRLSVRTALIAVVGVALALAALRGSTDLWWLATLIAQFGLLAWATLGAIVLRGPSRTPWFGIAMFGWLFFATAHPNRIFPDYRPSMQEAVEFLADSVHPNPPLLDFDSNSVFEEFERTLKTNKARSAPSRSRRANFTPILLMLLNVAFALVGGLAGRSFAARMRTDPLLASPIGQNRNIDAT